MAARVTTQNGGPPGVRLHGNNPPPLPAPPSSHPEESSSSCEAEVPYSALHQQAPDPSKGRRKQSRPLRIPLSESDLRAALPLNLSLHSRPPPLPPPSSSSSSPSGPSLPLPPPRIFNPEAFCDLCNKEFCNKYFLKTHRANKHGVYSDSPPGNGAGAGGPPALPDDGLPEGAEEGEVRAEGRAACRFCARDFGSELELRRHLGKRHGLMLPPFLLDFPFPPTPPLGPSLFESAEASCGPCARSFSSPYLLSIHNSYFHPGPGGAEGPKGPAEEERGADETTSDSDDLRRLESMILDLKNPPREGGGLGWSPAAEPAAEGPPPPTTVCPLCSKEFYSAYFLAQHLEESHQGSGPEDPPAPFLLPSKGEKRPSPSLSRSYCTICHKELCNKYFMRTHMLKMHGISIESSTGLGGVTCDICNKELCSKYFLKVHKQNTHGIVEEGPSPPAPAQPPSPLPPPAEPAKKGKGKGGGGKGRIRNGGPKKEEAPLDPLSLLFGKMEGQKAYRCAYCPFSTPLLVYLIAHEKTHVGPQTPPPAQPSPPVQCPLCFQAFPALQPFQHHLASHHGIPPPPPPPFFPPAFQGGGGGAGGPARKRPVFRCSACRARFRTRLEASAHIASSHAGGPPKGRKRPFRCWKCKFRGRSYAKMWIHSKVRHPPPKQREGVVVLEGDGGLVQRFVVRALGGETRFLRAAVELAVREPVREALEVRLQVVPAGDGARPAG